MKVITPEEVRRTTEAARGRAIEGWVQYVDRVVRQARAFPVTLHPLQERACDGGPWHLSYSEDVAAPFRQAGWRVEINAGHDPKDQGKFCIITINLPTG